MSNVPTTTRLGTNAALDAGRNNPFPASTRAATRGLAKMEAPTGSLVAYSTGPWGVSATYFHGEEEGDIALSGDDEVDAFVGAVSYSIGPGITGSLSLIYAKWEEEAGIIESESTLGIVGLAISF